MYDRSNFLLIIFIYKTIKKRTYLLTGGPFTHFNPIFIWMRFIFTGHFVWPTAAVEIASTKDFTFIGERSAKIQRHYFIHWLSQQRVQGLWLCRDRWSVGWECWSEKLTRATSITRRSQMVSGCLTHLERSNLDADNTECYYFYSLEPVDMVCWLQRATHDLKEWTGDRTKQDEAKIQGKTVQTSSVSPVLSM